MNGTLINYFYHCKRQCYLFANRINLEDNSEDVRIGRVLHETNEIKNKEIKVVGIAIDSINDKYIIEFKKSNSDIEASKMQLMFYLYKFRDLGIERKGRLEFFENKTKKFIKVELDEAKIIKTINEINLLLSKPFAPKAALKKRCKKCAYYEYCFL